MLTGVEFLRFLREAGFDFFTGVLCSLVKSLATLEEWSITFPRLVKTLWSVWLPVRAWRVNSHEQGIGGGPHETLVT